MEVFSLRGETEVNIFVCVYYFLVYEINIFLNVFDNRGYELVRKFELQVIDRKSRPYINAPPTKARSQPQSREEGRGEKCPICSN